jgi:DNA helicase-2/ATP-dependent DNA helicase PcrA
VERHGPEPEVKEFQQREQEEEEIKHLVNRFRNSSHRTLGIICKTLSQAKTLAEILNSKDVSLLTPESTSFREGVVITTIPLAKGLEFDEVIVPFASADYYQTDLDKSLLYIACTRAMHQLTLTFTKERSRFLV